MDWSEKLYNYCERGTDPAFWAEPFNAITNAGFLIAAWLALRTYRRSDAPSDPAILVLIALTAVIGIGSFLFHTLATRLAVLADVLPITVFMLVYLGFAVRRFAGANWWITALAVALFFAALKFAEDLPCPAGLLPVTQAGGHPCFNGSLGYVPALIVLAGMAVYLAKLGHQAAGYLAKAAVIMAVSLTLRTVDFEVCGAFEVFGRARGTHALWHLLNALLLYALLSAALVDRAARRN